MMTILALYKSHKLIEIPDDVLEVLNTYLWYVLYGASSLYIKEAPYRERPETYHWQSSLKSFM